MTGGIYGLGEGLVKGSIKNFPSHVTTGAKIGSAITTPVGGALGAIATGTIVAVAAIGAPVLSGLAVGLGMVGGTAFSAAKQLPSSVSQTARGGAAVGARAGQVLGPIGAAVGGVVGGTLGGAAGLVVALAKGLPGGLEVAKKEAVAGYNLTTSLPQFAKGTWNTAYHGGRAGAGGLGALTGGLTGLVTATGATGIDGVANSVSRGAQWGTNTAEYIRGE